MKRFTKLIEAMLVPAIAVICLLISLADLFGLFNLIPTSRIPMLTLLLLSLTLSSLSFVHTKSAESHQDVQRLLSKIEPEHMGKVLQQIDPHLRKVLKDDYFIDILEFFQIAVEDKKVPVNDVARFRFYFIRTLQSYPKSTFLSTAPHLCKDPTIEDAIVKFIQNGGKMEQIFFVKSAEEHASQEMQTILDRHRTIGVLVHIINSVATPNDLKKNFIVESKRKIAWELMVDNEGQVGAGIVTTNKHTTTSYYNIFEKLCGNEILR